MWANPNETLPGIWGVLATVMGVGYGAVGIDKVDYNNIILIALATT